jgi:hypothetical protein
MGVYSHKEQSTRNRYNAFPTDMPRWCFFQWNFFAKIRPEKVILTNSKVYSC